ncbi:MAG: hypothetical protein H6559_00870 [Lewinellaceae bacterium]|nr:hypothetical protein [Lewinellaceae bacterium]
MKKENEKLRREVEGLRRRASRRVSSRASGAEPETTLGPNSRASRRASCRVSEAEPEAEPEAELRASRRVSCRASEAEPEAEPEPQPQFDTPTKNHTQAAEAFWAWTQSRGYLPGLIANARYPGTLEQARDCCSDYFRNHQKNGRWVYIWHAPDNKNLAGFESWLARDPLFYPKKYQHGKTAATNNNILSEESARRVYATLLAEEGIVPVRGFPSAS